MKRFLLLLLIALLSAGLGAAGIAWFQGPKNDFAVDRADTIQFIREVLKLGVVEVRLSQIYEVKRENLTISRIPIPWTGQRSVVAVKGTGLAGYNLDQVKITIPPETKEVIVELPPPMILSVDLDFDVIHEADTFLNRLTPEDRNKIQKQLKEEAAKSFLTENLHARVERRTEDLLRNLSAFLGYPVRRLNPGPAL
jgi:hypothetical protein